jgi:hypothetical protein
MCEIYYNGGFLVNERTRICVCTWTCEIVLANHLYRRHVYSVGVYRDIRGLRHFEVSAMT